MKNYIEKPSPTKPSASIEALEPLLYQDDDSSLNAVRQTKTIVAEVLAKISQHGVDIVLNVYEKCSQPDRDLIAIGLMRSGDARTLDIILERCLSMDKTQRLASLNGLDLLISKIDSANYPRVLLTRSHL